MTEFEIFVRKQAEEKGDTWQDVENYFASDWIDLVQQFQLEHKQLGAGVWIRANERLPDDGKRVHIKKYYYNLSEPDEYIAEVRNGELVDCGNLKPFGKNYTIYWLDETPPQQPTPEAISAMAEKDIEDKAKGCYPAKHYKDYAAYDNQAAYIKGAKAILSALGYSAGDNEKEKS